MAVPELGTWCFASRIFRTEFCLLLIRQFQFQQSRPVLFLCLRCFKPSTNLGHSVAMMWRLEPHLSFPKLRQVECSWAAVLTALLRLSPQAAAFPEPRPLGPDKAAGQSWNRLRSRGFPDLFESSLFAWLGLQFGARARSSLGVCPCRICQRLVRSKDLPKIANSHFRCNPIVFSGFGKLCKDSKFSLSL